MINVRLDGCVNYSDFSHYTIYKLSFIIYHIVTHKTYNYYVSLKIIDSIGTRTEAGIFTLQLMTQSFIIFLETASH